MLKPQLLLLLPLFVLFCISCDDDPQGTTLGRYVFYVNGEMHGTKELHRYDIARESDELLSTENIISLSGIAANGCLLFETRHGSVWPPSHRLSGHYTDGQFITIPLPLSPDPSEEFSYVAMHRAGDPAPAAMAYEGQHAAYLAWKRPIASTDTTDWKLHLCSFDFRNAKTATLDISAFLEKYYAAQLSEFQPDRPLAQYAAIANDGGVIVLRLQVLQMEGGTPSDYRSLLLGGTLTDMHVLNELSTASTQGWKHVAFDGATGTLYVTFMDRSTTSYNCRGGSSQVQLSGMGVGFTQLSARSGELGVYNSNGHTITLERFFDGHMHEVPLLRETLERTFPDVQWLLGSNTWCMLSPDGDWVAFVAEHLGQRGLYAMHRDGTGLRRIALGIFDIPPIVSDVVFDIPLMR
jgi:hypothetical protein